MLINVLLSTFGIALRGINTGFNYIDTKFVSSSCSPQTIGEFLNCTDFPSIHDECDEDTSCEVKKALGRNNTPSEEYIGTRERLPTTTFSTLSPTHSYTQATQNTPTISPFPPTETLQKLETFTPLPETSRTSETNRTCETGYTGSFPDCKPKKCLSPSMGTYPNCFIPPCPPRYSGTYPKCKRPTDQICPFGSMGLFPNCVTLVQNCPEGSICDDMILEPSMIPSTQAPLSTSSERPLTNSNKIEWEDFKRMFNKTYSNQTVEHDRRQIFLRNQEIVHSHNERFERGLETYSLAINEFSDHTYDELISVDPLKEVVNRKRHDIVSVTAKEKNDYDRSQTIDVGGYNS